MSSKEKRKQSEKDIPVKYVVPLDQMFGEDPQDWKLLRVMADGARTYLECFPWCKSIKEAYFGDGYGGVVAVFLFRIEPSRLDVDEWLWVVFGDVPPAHLVTDACKTPAQALMAYVDEMSKWVQLAKHGTSSKDVIPVHIPSTPENAAEVQRRLDLLRTAVVPAFLSLETMKM